MPDDPDVARRLRHKATLPQEAERAGVDAPRTVAADSIETLRALDLRPPFLLKPVEGQHFAGSFGEKVMVAPTPDELVAAWKRAKRARVRHGRPGAHPGLRETDLVAVRLHRPQRPAARDRDRREGAAGPAPLRHERRLPHDAAAARARARAAAARERGLQGLRPRRVRARPPRRRLQAARGEHARADVGRGRDDAAASTWRGSRTTTSAAARAGAGRPAARALVGVPRQGPLRLAADGEAARADAAGLRAPVPAAAQGARRLRGGRPAAGARRARVPALEDR